jgi:DNA processing protein
VDSFGFRMLSRFDLPPGRYQLRIGARAGNSRAPRPAARGTLLAALGFDPVDLDTLAARTGRDAGGLAAELLELELAQDVERLPGNRYQRLR